MYSYILFGFCFSFCPDPRLDSDIYHHVKRHHQDLLNKATEIDNLHNVLQLTEEKISNLSYSMDKVKCKVQVPFESLQQHIIRFRHLQVTAEVLRKIARIALLVKRVQARSSDLSKLSGFLNEIDYLFSSMDWKGIHILESYKRTMDQSREDMVNQAWGLVNASYELADQAQLGLGLQVFQHFGILSEVIVELIQKWKTEFEESLVDAIDVEKLTQRVRNRQPKVSGASGGPGRASLPGSGGQAAAFHVAMWTSLDSTVDRLERFLLHCRLLGLTLLKQRDTVPGAVSIHPVCRIGDSVDSHPSLAELLLDELLQNECMAVSGKLRTTLVLLFTSVHVRSHQLNIDPTLFESIPPQSSDPTALSPQQRAAQSVLIDFCTDLKANEGFLGWALDILSDHLSKAASQSSQIREPLHGEYPKLLKLLLDLERRLRQTQLFSDSDVSNLRLDGASLTGQPGAQGEQLHQQGEKLPVCILRALSPFETAYLSRSLSRLFDRVAMVFSPTTNSNSSIPDTNDVDGIVQNAVNELAYATVHYDLLCKVSRNVAKMIALFASKVEGLITVGQSAEQCVDAPTPGQQNNIRLVNLLCAFGTQIELTCNRRLRNLPVLQNAPRNDVHSPFDVIQEALKTSLNSLCVSILDPLLRSVGEVVLEILETMHGESFNETEPRNTGSQYMENLKQFVNLVRRQYLSGLTRSSRVGGINTSLSAEPRLARFCDGCFFCGEIALQEAIRPHLRRWIDAFLIHISLVRPLSEAGRMQLATDCVEFAAALNPLSMPNMELSLSELVPEHYAQLCALKPYLITSTEEIVKVFTKPENTVGPTKLDRCIPPSLICQHLFSRAPAEIRSPHEAVGWSVVQYVKWLQSGRSEAERMAFLRNGLAVYTREVEMRQQREYAPIYLQLRAFLQHQPGDPEKLSRPEPSTTST
ncbi:Conserved oligomeric Golgi complex subunit 5 [Fasciola hepatica]|uniref:Conserved oligomeric Golgi complex subunit 5 n=1 Tax=Fasciola hepatica TaxID=6192 RepID=A0A4E0R9Q8_FASHE|nr:Conserved oligomeric Golgi complex subunit 5 [Fasciola hepatica]